MEERKTKWSALGNEASLGGIGSYGRQFGIGSEQAKKELHQIPTYTRYKVPRRSAVQNPYRVYRAGELLQLDLLDISNLSRQNRGVRYLVTCLDTYSRFVCQEGIKRKTADVVISAAERLFDIFERISGVEIARACFDKGSEFGGAFLQMLERRGIQPFYGNDHCHAVERVQLTIQRLIYRFLADNNSKRYIDSLQEILHTYNNKRHRITGFSPMQALRPEFRTETLNNILYDHYKRNTYAAIAGMRRKRRKARLKVGDIVRILKYADNFARGYGEKFSQQLYKVNHIDAQHADPTYLLTTHPGGEEVIGSFVYSQLSKVSM